jgi:organic hydroperoxide reductase OsmC/OhrA
MVKEHHYQLTATWTGNLGSGTSTYRAYSRDHEIDGDQKSVPIPGSSDPAFLGEGSRYNPEELLIACCIFAPKPASWSPRTKIHP